MTIGFLLELGWKSALIAVLGLGLLALLRGRSARDRATFLRVAVLMLLTLPLLAALGPKLTVEHPPLIEADVASSVSAESMASGETAGAATRAVPVVVPQMEISWTHILFALYASGVLVVLARLGIGLLTLRRWTLRARPLREFNWRIAFDRALHHAGLRVPVGGSNPVALLVSRDAPAPLGWGLRRPAILIDSASAARPQDAEAILAHELAHVARRDWVHLMLARVAVAIFWFNPLVWLLERRLVQAAEEAADMHAVERLDPAGYAQVLLACMAAPLSRALPANAMVTNSGLGRRVCAILDSAERGRGSGSIWTIAGIGACVVAAAPIATIDLIPAAAPTPPAVTVQAYAHVATPVQFAVNANPDVSATVAVKAAEATATVQLTEVALLLEPQPPAPPSPPAPPPAVAAPQPPEPPTPPVQPEWRAAPAPPAPPVVPEWNAAPPAPPSPPTPPHLRFSASQLEEMQAVGLTPEWVADMARQMGRVRISVDTAVELRAMGLTPQKLREYARVGYAARRTSEYTDLAAMDVTPGYIRALATAGFAGLSVDELVELKAMGVSAEFARRMRRDRGHVSAEELVELMATGGMEPVRRCPRTSAGGIPASSEEVVLHDLRPHPAEGCNKGRG